MPAAPRSCSLRVDATIGSVAPGGDGVAHVELDGERRAVFVPHTAAGDVVRVEVDPSTRPARGRLVAVVAPSTDRVPAACTWSTRCGGCDWMHLSLEAQARTHLEHVRAALPAPWRELPIEAHATTEPLGHRIRARLHVRCERGRVAVGMHEARTHDPVEVDACVVLDPALESARAGLATLFEGSRGRGDVQIALGAGRLAVLEVRWTGELAPACFARLERAVGERTIAGARVTLGDATRPAVVGDPTPWMTGGDGAPLRLAPGGFGQATERMNARLVQHVAAQVAAIAAMGAAHEPREPHERREPRDKKAVELYAGAGNLSVALAREVTDLVLVEASRDACDAARANLSARGLQARVVEADVETYAWGAATRLVVLDPPRTGARAVAQKLVASRVAHVVYVSCDPQTLGRDLAVLASTYDVRSIATFEMFPQTSHVETVVMLERDRRRRAAGGRQGAA